MAFFIIFVYLRSWFTASFLYSSANADLDLYKRINRFSKVDKKVADVAKSVLQRHTWYLTEELIPLSLFDSNLPAETRNKLADRISKLPECEMKIQKPGLPKIRLGVRIPDFVGPRSCVLFKTIGVSYSFLALQNWKEQPEYYQIKAAIKNLTPLNDCSERALALATTYCGALTKEENCYQDLMLVVEEHRKNLRLRRKQT